MATLREKLREIEENHPEIYQVLSMNLPDLVNNPESPSVENLDEYNFWIDAIDEDEAQHLYHLDGLS